MFFNFVQVDNPGFFLIKFEIKQIMANYELIDNNPTI